MKRKDDVIMTEKIRYTYRPPKELYEAVAREASRKNMAINSTITNILWDYYFPKETDKEMKK